MFRILFSLLLILALGAGATAQTAPAPGPTASPKTTTRTTTTTHRPVKKARRTTIRKTTVKRLGAATNTTPAPAPAPASPAVGASGGNGVTGSTEGADGKGQGSYAAPGMPIDVQSGKVESYNGPAPSERTRAKKSTTLAPK